MAGRDQAATSGPADFSLPNNGLPDVSSAMYHHHQYHESVIRQRYMELVDPWGPSELYFVRNHRLIRRHKVYLNVYHLVKPTTNKGLTRVGLGGAYHSAIELKGAETAFGGHYDNSKGIYEARPGLWQQRKEELAKIEQLGLTKAELKQEKRQRLAMLPPLKDRLVLGTWTGNSLEWERILSQLQKTWRGPEYRLLSKNCNNFVGDLYEALRASRFFDAVPGVSSKSFKYLYKLPKKATALCCCIPCLAEALDEPNLPAPYSGDVFCGRGRKLCEGPRIIHPQMTGLQINNRLYESEESGWRDGAQSPVGFQGHHHATSNAIPADDESIDYDKEGLDNKAAAEAWAGRERADTVAVQEDAPRDSRPEASSIS